MKIILCCLFCRDSRLYNRGLKGLIYEDEGDANEYKDYEERNSDEDSWSNKAVGSLFSEDVTEDQETSDLELITASASGVSLINVGEDKLEHTSDQPVKEDLTFSEENEESRQMRDLGLPVQFFISKRGSSKVWSLFWV